MVDMPSANALTPAACRRKGDGVAVASMTGFARTAGEAYGVSWSWEIKSVNGRSLDLRLRLPPGFDALEPRLRASLAERFRRGNFTANLSIVHAAPPELRINRDTLARLVALRGVVETVESEDETVIEARQAAVMSSWEEALAAIATARTDEGARLGRLLRTQLDEMAALTAQAADCAAAQPAALRERLVTAL